MLDLDNLKVREMTHLLMSFFVVTFYFESCKLLCENVPIFLPHDPFTIVCSPPNLSLHMGKIFMSDMGKHHLCKVISHY